MTTTDETRTTTPATTPGTGIDLTGVAAADLAAVVARSAPTSHARLVAWVNEVAALTTPDRIHWVDGTEDEREALIAGLVEAGTFVPLDERRPNSYWCASDPSDVARVEDRTFICSVDRDGRRPHQQLDGPGRDARPHDRPVPRLHARPHACT